jgi:pimeloyl-ACP methyl ester carboxylesterase
VLIAIVLLLALAWWLARPAIPDAFYDYPLTENVTPGTLLRSETFLRHVPEGAMAWRFLYGTTRFDNSPAIASAILIVPETMPQTPKPVIAWAHGTTGIMSGCAPSVMRNPFANVPALEPLLDQGWAYVASDYAGLGTSGHHAYLVGEDAARQVLDAVQAARQISDVKLESRAVVWGHSQGGNTALWTARIAKDYAPKIDILGIAALAPASDLNELIERVQGTMFGEIVSSYLIHAYEQAYPDIAAKDYLTFTTSLVTRDIASRCAGEWGTLLSAGETLLLPKAGIFARDPATGPLGERLIQNSPREPFSIPLLIAQGDRDDLVLPEVQSVYAHQMCASGQAIDYRVYGERDHLSLVAEGSPLEADLIAWTVDRFMGKPWLNTCGEMK